MLEAFHCHSKYKPLAVYLSLEELKWEGDKTVMFLKMINSHRATLSQLLHLFLMDIFYPARPGLSRARIYCQTGISFCG